MSISAETAGLRRITFRSDSAVHALPVFIERNGPFGLQPSQRRHRKLSQGFKMGLVSVCARQDLRLLTPPGGAQPTQDARHGSATGLSGRSLRSDRREAQVSSAGPRRTRHRKHGDRCWMEARPQRSGREGQAGRALCPLQGARVGEGRPSGRCVLLLKPQPKPLEHLTLRTAHPKLRTCSGPLEVGVLRLRANH